VTEPRLLDAARIVDEMNRMIARGHRVRELAWAAQIDESSIRRLRNGTHTHIRFDNAERLADAMGKSLSVLYPARDARPRL
jgi:DNA-binding Xre family transcriptional regulator